MPKVGIAYSPLKTPQDGGRVAIVHPALWFKLFRIGEGDIIKMNSRGAILIGVPTGIIQFWLLAVEKSRGL